MTAVLVDTDVVSYAFKKDSRARSFRPHLVGRQMLVSFMTLAELQLWTLHRNWGESTRQRLWRFMQQIEVIYADAALCHLWAEVCRKAERAGRSIDGSDAWIAATALALDVPLVTNNVKDFAGVAGLMVLGAVP